MRRYRDFRGASSQAVLSFKNQSIRDAMKAKYLSSPEIEIAARTKVLKYLRSDVLDGTLTLTLTLIAGLEVSSIRCA